MKITSVPIAAKDYIKPCINDEHKITVDDIKNNRILVKVSAKEGQDIYWVIENQEELGWIKSQINSKNEEIGNKPSSNISLVILDNCPKNVFQPTRKAHLSAHFDIKNILKKANLIEDKAAKTARKKSPSFQPAKKISLEYVLYHLPKVYEETDGKAFKESFIEKCIAKLLLSFHWLDGGGWQLLADLIKNVKSIYYYLGTGMGAGSVVFLVALIEGLVTDLPKVKRGDLQLDECFKNVFGNAAMYGVAASLSNALWLALANEANKHGEDEIKTFLYTGFGCAGVFFAALFCIKAIYRILEAYQTKKVPASISAFFTQDLPNFAKLSVNIATSAAAFCFILFPKILGMENIFVVNPTKVKDFATNLLKSAMTTFIGFWLGEIIKATVSSLIPCLQSEEPISEEKILKELTKQIHQHYPNESSSLIVTQN